MHGVCPLDVEYVAVEAWARLFAEKVDGLVLPNLIYFAPGGTQTGVGTINVSPVAGMNYLLEIMHSLVDQGFKRLILLPAHGPTKGFLYTAIQQFFEETRISAFFLSPMTMFAKQGIMKPRVMGMHGSDPITKGEQLGCNTTMLGAYKICNRLADCPTGEETDGDPGLRPEGLPMNNENPTYPDMLDCMDVHLPTPALYLHAYSHGSGPMPWTREELEKEAEIGEAYMRDLVDRCEFDKHLVAMANNQKYIDEVVLPAHGKHLRGKKYSK